MTSLKAVTGSLLCTPAVSGAVRPCTTIHGKEFRPIWIELAYVLPPSPRPRGLDGVPLRVRAAGIDVSATVPGVLVAWHQTITGDWWALATFELTNRSGKPGIVVPQLVPANAVKPR